MMREFADTMFALMGGTLFLVIAVILIVLAIAIVIGAWRQFGPKKRRVRR